MKDPKHKGNGFYDINDVNSIIRAIQNDHGMRLFNSIQVREGKQSSNAQVERDLHEGILMQHMYFTPFADVQELVEFVYDYQPKNSAQETVQSIMKNRIPDLTLPRRELLMRR